MASSPAGQPSASWVKFVNERPIASLVLTAVIATQLGTYFGYVFPAFGLPTLPWPMYNGALGTGIFGPNWGTYFEDGSNAAGLFFVGQALHFVNGIVFGILFGVLFRGMLNLKDSNGGNIAKGLIYGVIMTIISVAVLVPYAYVPYQGYGLFLLDGPDGWKLPFSILVWHLIYGFFLGALYQPKEKEATA
jgi:hypothetical protein